MAENLIINGVDHAKLDLEWAKRGGVLICADPESTKKLFKFVRNIDLEKIEVTVLGWLDGCPVTNFWESKTVFRMATPDECKAAGIEYIDPPIRWLQIDSAPEDGRIIEVADFRVVVANECPLSKHWKFWRDIPHPFYKNSMTQPPKEQ